MTTETTAVVPAGRGRRVPAVPWLRDDCGASTLEAAILAPVLLLLIGMAVVAMRIQVADQAVESAASPMISSSGSPLPCSS